MPLADLLTPNRPEAELLAGMSIAGEEDMAEAGKRLLDLGAKAVLIKGCLLYTSCPAGASTDTRNTGGFLHIRLLSGPQEREGERRRKSPPLVRRGLVIVPCGAGRRPPGIVRHIMST